MKGLYKGKYLIAVYDKSGYLLDVACSPSELTCFKSQRIAIEYINQIANGHRVSDRIFLIDVTEKQHDVFAAEDQLFLEHIEITRKRTNKEIIKELGINERTYYRRKIAERVYNEELEYYSSQWNNIVIK